MRSRPYLLTQRAETVSVIDEKVNGTVDGLEKIVEADEHSERLWRNTEATLVKVEEIESAEFENGSA